MSLYLGIDCGTQSLKGIIIDTVAGGVVAHTAVDYATDLPDFHRTEIVRGDDPRESVEDPLLWVAALEALLAKLRDAGVATARIAGIGGSGQQHGSVYLRRGFERRFAAFDPAKPLVAQIAPTLARPVSPVWTDSSTADECAELTQALGDRIRERTGSPATERFTGPQIRKFFKRDPAAYAATARIHLVSSFLASVLTGGDAPADTGDGAGMNLLDLAAGRWDATIAEATAPDLVARLPRIATRDGVAGGLCAYFEKYGLKAGVPVAVWTGDNPASLVGMGATAPGVATVSLGTSDTFFAALDTYRTDPAGYGHVFGNPAGGFMCLTCFRNGSLARDRVRREAGVDWAFFGDTAFAVTTPGNDGRLVLPWFDPEITPRVAQPGLRANFDFEAAAPAERIRAVVETQTLALRAHAAWIGDFATLRVTGGASRSAGILRTLADVFQARVETIAVTDSAALGAALIAAHRIGKIPYDTLYRTFCAAGTTVPPTAAHAALYDRALTAFDRFEREQIAAAVPFATPHSLTPTDHALPSSIPGRNGRYPTR